MDRERRNVKKVDKFAALRAAREGGSRSEQWMDSNVDIYDTVSTEAFNKIVKGRMQKDDFVVDDDGGGYQDNGMDDWEAGEDTRMQSSEESDDDAKKARRKAKTAEREVQKRKGQKSAKAPAPVQPAALNAYRPAPAPHKEEDFMNSLLSSMNTSAPHVASSSSRKRKPSPARDSRKIDMRKTLRPRMDDGAGSSESEHVPDALPSFNRPSSPASEVDTMPFRSTKRPKGSSDDPVGVTNGMNNLGFKSEAAEPDEFDLMDIDDAGFEAAALADFGLAQDTGDVFDDEKDIKGKNINAPRAAKFAIEKKDEDAPPSWLSIAASLAKVEGPSDSTDTLLSAPIDPNNASKVNALEDDGSLRMFWLDYLELAGKVYFIGKVLDRSVGKGSKPRWVSCCVTVDNLERNLFVLPRGRRVSGKHVTDVVPTLDDVRGDFDAIRKQAGIKSWRSKPVKRKYAFGEEDIPEGEADWLKVTYSFSEPQLPLDVSSPNIARIMGTGTSAFELLVLKRRIMGPCWLQIKEPEISTKGVSWCKLEVTVSDPKDINPFSEKDASAPRDMPPLTTMSISVRSILNHKANTREVVCASVRIWENINIDDPTPPEKLPSSGHTIVRMIEKWPGGFEAAVKSEKIRIIHVSSEKALLNNVIAILARYDPDIIVGHEFLGVSLDILLHRMRANQVDLWSKLGRFRRSKWSIGKPGTNLRAVSGRLLSDLASDAAKSMISSTTWSLTEMCQSQLSIDREDIDPDETADYFDGTLSVPDRLLHFVRHCEIDTFFQMAISTKVQMLPLAHQLTALAGNSWNKTLNGGRAERNEYILLHEFHRLKYICPDKSWGKKTITASAKAETADIEADPTKAKTTKSKKDKYKGGLVFEPKRGLWDKYILVMDFNSLYPSIIQEYNIDFTTVAKAEEKEVEDEENDDKVPEVPAAGIPQGVLPRLIATLVSRRKIVKNLMKDRTATPAQLLQYDIKQKALKLTANSMYGCLGFEFSRFYARPLAALVTFKGREILRHTRELAQNLQLDVVYGDTDSVFVNSNVTDLAEALKTANEFKKQVNDRYKLLEIDLDGIFKRLLLLQKKKYAAVKIEEGGKTSTEIKGLDMKRREYSVLSKDASSYVLHQILSGEATETVVELIHEYLRGLGDEIRAGKKPLDDFIIFKRLGKNPEDYPSTQSLPHVEVARRLKKKGGSARLGDVIPYIFCVGEDGTSSKTAKADRAFHPDDLRKGDSVLQVDYEHYLSLQILPPIERLCEPIQGTDRTQLATCLGLDPTQYQVYVAGENEEQPFETLESQIPDKERFKDSEPFKVWCPRCEASTKFSRFGDIEAPTITASGPRCSSCKGGLSAGSLQTQLELQIRQHISRYYDGWAVCSDPECRIRTRSVRVYGRKCLRTDCKGLMAFEYSDLKLYNQLLYFASLFNEEKVLASVAGTARQVEVSTLANFNRPFLTNMSEAVEKYLGNCGRRWVDLEKTFSFMRLW